MSLEAVVGGVGEAIFRDFDDFVLSRVALVVIGIEEGGMDKYVLCM